MEKKYTLLIVDDSDYNIDLLTEIFKKEFNIFAAYSADEALNILCDRSREISVVLLDIVMPEKDGYYVLEQMQNDPVLKYIPVITITAEADTNSELKALKLGAVDFISRPFNLQSVYHRVRGVIHKQELDEMRLENTELKREIDTERQLTALMNNIPGGVAIITIMGNEIGCSYFNASLAQLFGRTKDDFLEDILGRIRHDALSTEAFVKLARTTGKSDVSFSLIKPNGEEQWLRVIASRIGDSDGKIVMYCVFLDINEEKIQEKKAKENKEKLEKSEHEMEAMINNAPGGIILSEEQDDGHFITLYASKGMADILRLPDTDKNIDEMKKGGYLNLLDFTNEKFTEQIQKAKASGAQIETTLQCTAYDGSPLWLNIRSQLIKNADEKYRLYSFINDVTVEKEYENELKANAFFDSLTMIYNRNAFFVTARTLLDENPDIDFNVMRLNIGKFKTINDTLGRYSGDAILIAVAEAIKKFMPEKSVYARFFSDNFAVCYPTGSIVPEDLLSFIAEYVAKKGFENHELQYYAGIYSIKDKEASLENMSDWANLACRSITGSYNNHVVYYDERMRLALLEEQEISEDAHRALQNEEFCIFYQPVYGIKDKCFVSAEALVRWKHSKKGMISPGKFIPVFEKNGLIAELDIYVLRHVCMYHRKRKEMGLPSFPISVNISRMSLYNSNLYNIINDMAAEYEIEPQYMRIEITESAYNDNPVQILETVGKLRERGFPVLMDDFGSGYSSLNTLKDIPVDILKLDMKFMQDFENNERVGTIVTSVNRMSKWLHIPMLAEGVETKEQYLFLKSIGCYYIQGYFFAKPVPEEQFTSMIGNDVIPEKTDSLESIGMGDEMNEIMGGNSLVSKLINGVFGGLGIYEKNGDKLEVIRVNDRYLQIMGYTSEDMASGNIDVWTKIHPDDVQKSIDAVEECIRTDSAVRQTVRRYNKKGEIIYLEGVHRRLSGTDENPIICIAFNDITDRINSKETIEHSQREIQTILDAMGAVLIDYEPQTGELFCAGKFKERYGISEEELKRRFAADGDFADVVHPDDFRELRLLSRDCSVPNFVHEFRVKMANGEYRWNRYTSAKVWDENGNLTHSGGVVVDVTVKRNAEIELARSRELISAAMSNIDAGIIMLKLNPDNTSDIIYANDGLWNIIGKKREEVTDFVRCISEITHPGDLQECIKVISKNDSSYKMDFRINKGDSGEWSWLSANASRMDNSDRFCVVITDITEMKSVSMQLATLMDSAPFGIALYEIGSDKKLVPVYLTESFYALVGYDKEKRSDSEFDLNTSILPEDLPKIREAMTEGDYAHFQFRVKKDDGTIAWLEVNTALMDFNVKGKKRYMVVITDITVQKRTMGRIEAIMENFDGGIAMIDKGKDGFTLPYTNDKFFTVLNTTKNSARLPRILANLINDDYGNTYIRDITVTKDEEDRLVSAHITKVSYGTSRVSYIAVITDITEKSARDRELLLDKFVSALSVFYKRAYEVNYSTGTVRLIMGESLSETDSFTTVENIILFWTEKNVHPSDKKTAQEFFSAPIRSRGLHKADAELRVLCKDDKKYRKISSTLVRIENDQYILLLKDASPEENHESVRHYNDIQDEVNRFDLAAKHTHTTVIEFDHKTGRIFSSASISMFAASRLSEIQFSAREQYIKGLAIHEDDRSSFREFIENLKRDGSMSETVLRMEMIDGSYKWCRIGISFLLDEKGSIYKSLCTISVIHDEIEAQRDLRHISDVLGMTVKNIPVGVGIFKQGIEGCYHPVYVSDKVCSIFGVAPDDKDLDKIISIKFTGKLSENKKKDVTQLFTRPNGSAFWLNIKYKIVRESDGEYLYAALDDVSDSVEEDYRREIQDQIYHMLLDEARTVVFDYSVEEDTLCYYPWSKSGRQRSVNIPKMLEQNIIPKAFSRIDGSAFNETLKRLSCAADVDELTLKMEKDGKSRWYRAFFKSIEDNSGKVYRIIGKIDDIDDEISRIDQVKERAMYDSLCVDIYNKATTEELIKAELDGHPHGSLLMLDVDDFKSINDRLGHLFGDEFLKKFASTVKSVFRDTDIVGRYGGDEFFIYLNHADVKLAEKKANSILEKISMIEIPEIGAVRSSIGIASANRENRDYRHILKQADSALYQAKNRGKNCVVVYNPDVMDETSFRIEEGTTKRPVISSNPGEDSSVIMRVFSALYSAGDLKSGIDKMLETVGKHFDVSRVYIFENSQDNRFCSNTFEWCNVDVISYKDELQNLSYDKELYGYEKNMLNDDGIFYCQDINTLDSAQRKIVEPQNIKSMLQCAIMDNGVFKGFVGFDECRNNRFWTQSQIDTLIFISKIISVFLIKEKSRNQAVQYAQSLNAVLDCYPAYVYIIDPDSMKVLYMNEPTRKVLNGEMDTCHGMICGDPENPDCPIKKFSETGKSAPMEMYSPVLKCRIRASARKIMWQGKERYLVTCVKAKRS